MAEFSLGAIVLIMLGVAAFVGVLALVRFLTGKRRR